MERNPDKFWNPYLAGAVLGLVLLSAFLVMGKGLGASNTSLRLGVTAIQAVAPGYGTATPSLARTRAEGHPLDNWLVFEVVGVLLGGFVAAYTSGRPGKETLKGPRISTPARWGMAFGGGVLMGVLIGFGFGFTLERAGFGRAQKLVGQFYGYDMTVFKVMFSAIVTAMLGLVVLSGLGLADFRAVAEKAASSTYLWPMLVGGLLLGAGFIISGYCPGTSWVATASGKIDGLLTVLGVIVGQVAYAELLSIPVVARFQNSGDLGRLFLWDLLKLPSKAGPPMVAIAVTIMAVGCFIGAEKLEKVLAARADPAARATPAGRSGRFVFAGLAASALVGLALVALPTGTQAARQPRPIAPLDLARRVV